MYTYKLSDGFDIRLNIEMEKEMEKRIAFIDSEIGIEDKNIHDLGAIKYNGDVFHSPSVSNFADFIADCDYLCGHNIIHHDMKYLSPFIKASDSVFKIDTLYLSPLLFPERPYHALLKDDKLQTDELNNPLNDSEKVQKLFYDELNKFFSLSGAVKHVYYHLLCNVEEFRDFFKYAGFTPIYDDTVRIIRNEYKDKICENADIDILVKRYPVELAYALALIGTEDYHSVTPPWLLRNYPKIENVIRFLCNTPCEDGCSYCKEKLNIHKKLKAFFGYDGFRTYNGEPLQEKAAQAAVDGKSLLAVFPTGGGKSITFQLPALMAGESVHGLTVVISPLQSLMKDQVDNLSEKGIVDAVTINGLLSSIERAEALDRVANGIATILYISPEQLRSRTIERLLLSRNIVRFVIDEAHCFSAWGQDFRVDYLYIGDFIRRLQKKKQMKKPVPVSCFTATAKQKVITDICDYFKQKLDVDLELFASSATRENLHYAVLYKETDEEKYNTLRALIEQKNCPTIVYASRTRRCRQLAEKLTSDGFPARAYYGQMETSEKVANQEAFMNNEISVIVATSAFGMGVDKSDVKLVIHYDISDSLENYVQEAGRAGRDPSLQAECFVLYNDNDLDKHFMLLNQTKLSMSEIQQVWKAMKEMTRYRPTVCCSALEIARQAGWDDSVKDIETRVKTAVSALENAGYVKRGQNVPKVYADSILVRNMAEAGEKIDNCSILNEKQKENAKRIIKSLISSRSIAKAGNDDAESRVDYLADTLGIEKCEVIDCVNLMRQEGLLADSHDMSAYILKSDSQNKTSHILERFIKLEKFLLSHIKEQGNGIALKELNEAAMESGISSTVKQIRTLLYFLTIKEYITKEDNQSNQYVVVTPSLELHKLFAKFYRRIDICRFIVDRLFEMASEENTSEEILVQFSLVGVYNDYLNEPRLDKDISDISIEDVKEALLYLSKIGAMKLEGGFLVIYSGMEIKRLILDNKIRYKVDDYKTMSDFYKQKIQQIHIVGEYANLMVRDYEAALQFVQDYFHMDFRKFIQKYFKGERAKQIDRNITPEKYNQLFGTLSDTQSQIINDAESRYIVVAAGPGSGKTRVLVHKLAALYLMEDVKHEQLLMVTFSRAAATEFKKRLMELIGNAANFIEIKTFHSYCFDLLGKIGSLEGVENVVRDAAKMISDGEVEPGRIAKSVLVIDEAQDMDENEFALVRALMNSNDGMRVIAVGDDDQNIYEFRGSDSRYLQLLIDEYGAKKYEMNDNYRSTSNIVALANEFISSVNSRMKSEAIRSMSEHKGVVQLIHHSTDHLEEAVANHVVKSYKSGKSCVLTRTNEEALKVFSLLIKKGIRAKLIQTMGGFKLYNLAEIRFFLKQIDKELKTPLISDELWNKAKSRLRTVYFDSECLEVCLNLLFDFEQVNSYSKYRTDLEEFIKESNYEDFHNDDMQTVYVSTIHKSKGREFDAVYMLLNNVDASTDEERHSLYVGMTRAKTELYIHYNNSLFDSYNIADVTKIEDVNSYNEPCEITLQLTHRDVVLDYFKERKEIVYKLHSGAKLNVDGVYLSVTADEKTTRVAKLSKACIRHMEALSAKGYKPVSAFVRFVVAWKGEDDEQETPILLADVHLKKPEEM